MLEKKLFVSREAVIITDGVEEVAKAIALKKVDSEFLFTYHV